MKALFKEKPKRGENSLRTYGLSDLLKDKLSASELRLVYKSYDIIGDIAIIRVPQKLETKSGIIAEALMELHGHVKAVWRQSGAVSGELRLRDLEHLTGEKRTTTTYKEHGCVFRVDLLNCYFSPRLAYERMRIAQLVKPNEVIVNMFAGVGSFSIIMTKHSQVERVYSIDINPKAFEYMRENVLLNRVPNRVVSLCGDAKELITERLRGIADRVLMPLPEKAYEYLECAVESLRPRGGWVHYYDFEHVAKGEDPIAKVKTKISRRLSQLSVDVALPFGRVVRDIGPRWQQVVVDVQIGEKS
jgi:tRNA (guanine37-N1)-methyltransferase